MTKKIIKWGSPKSYQRNRDIIKGYKKKSKVCKYTKQDHNFILTEQKQFRWNNYIEIIKYYKCGCGKKKLEFETLPHCTNLK